jgi:penicillin G amidase
VIGGNNSGRARGAGRPLGSSGLGDHIVLPRRSGCLCRKAQPRQCRRVPDPGRLESVPDPRSIIRVKDQEPRTLTLRWTDNGPVLPGTHYGLGTITPAGHVTSIAWTLLDPSDTSMSAAMRLMQAAAWTRRSAAGALYIAPSQNLMLADREGIATQLIGAMPRRDPVIRPRAGCPRPAGWPKIAGRAPALPG